MKKILLGIVIVPLFFAGCKKMIDEVPYDFLTPQNFPTTAAEADDALNGCYTVIKGPDGNQTWDYTGGLWMNVQNDVSIYSTSSSWWSSFKPTTVNGREPYWWADYWKGINAANNLIAALDARDINKDPWVTPKLAEARAIRAFFYHNLASLFGDLPLRMKPTTEMTLKVPRSPVQNIYDSIILPDLAFADGKLPVINSPSGRISEGGLKCIEADVYMKLAGWRRSSQGQMVAGDSKYWAMARDAAKAVIDMEAAGVYALEPHYSDVFTKLSTDVATHEVIFDLEYTQDAGSNFPYVYGVSGPASSEGGGGNGLLKVIPEWVRTQDNRDERWKWNIGDYKLSGWTKTPLADTAQWCVATFQKIYPSTGYWQDHLTNWPFYRLSEAKLMYAEAANEAEGGPSAEAYKQINAVRYRARPDDHKTDGTILPDLSGLTQDQFRQAVRNERAMEFINEGKRHLDLVRWGILKEKIESMQVFQYLVDAGGMNLRYYLWPLPLTEVTPNEWAQNEGY